MLSCSSSRQLVQTTGAPEQHKSTPRCKACYSTQVHMMELGNTHSSRRQQQQQQQHDNDDDSDNDNNSSVDADLEEVLLTLLCEDDLEHGVQQHGKDPQGQDDLKGVARAVVTAAVQLNTHGVQAVRHLHST